MSLQENAEKARAEIRAEQGRLAEKQRLDQEGRQRLDQERRERREGPIDRRAKDALWHLAGLWARVMYVLIIINIVCGVCYLLFLLGLVFLHR